MLFFDLTVHGGEDPTPEVESKDREERERQELRARNEALAARFPGEKAQALVYGRRGDEWSVLLYLRPDQIERERAMQMVAAGLDRRGERGGSRLGAFREITSKEAAAILSDTYNRRVHFGRRPDREMGLDYYDNSYFTVSEGLIPEDAFSQEDAVAAADRIMGDDTLYEELGRIYAPENREAFFGFPVHYRISAGNIASADSIVEILTHALYQKKRIPGRRICRVSHITEGCYGEKDLENLIKQAQGASVVIELCGAEVSDGDRANSYESVVRFIAELMERYHWNTQFFLIENTQVPGFSKELLERTEEFLDLIQVKEGKGDREAAVSYFRTLAQGSRYAEFYEEDALAYLDDRKSFRNADVQASFSEWHDACLKEKVYRAYHGCRKEQKPREVKRKAAKRRLGEMVGLTEAKAVIAQVVSSFKIQEARSRAGLSKRCTAKHMLFTGNPGSAKTTVARLLTDILNEEGLLRTGAFVECGRNDLVGKYVGWTAKIVAQKFRKAEGGVLFIDEAYSLVEDHRSYGAEAIDTIVREMENRREDVVVIFAGYPDRMREFLDSNEGLRSRISFHLDFPDYRPEELSQILALMVRDAGYRLDDEAREKCDAIFQQVCATPQYGNGRFVRNLLEQAEMRQADRLMREGRRLSRKRLQLLGAEDFDVNLSEVMKSQRHSPMGFAV